MRPVPVPQDLVFADLHFHGKFWVELGGAQQMRRVLQQLAHGPDGVAAAAATVAINDSVGSERELKALANRLVMEVTMGMDRMKL